MQPSERGEYWNLLATVSDLMESWDCPSFNKNPFAKPLLLNMEKLANQGDYVIEKGTTSEQDLKYTGGNSLSGLSMNLRSSMEVAASQGAAEGGRWRFTPKITTLPDWPLRRARPQGPPPITS
jgi:hypothetical protein